MANRSLEQVDQAVAEATPWRYQARAVRVAFPLADTPYEVVHQLGDVPDGHQVLDSDCLVIRAPGQQHTKEIAYVQSDRANSFAVLVFGMYREEPLNVQASK